MGKPLCGTNPLELVNFFSSLLRQIVEEAGGSVTRMDGGGFCVFDRSVVVSNGLLHAKVCLFFSYFPWSSTMHCRNLQVTLLNEAIPQTCDM